MASATSCCPCTLKPLQSVPQCWPLSWIQNHHPEPSHLLKSTDANFPHSHNNQNGNFLSLLNLHSSKFTSKSLVTQVRNLSGILDSKWWVELWRHRLCCQTHQNSSIELPLTPCMTSERSLNLSRSIPSSMRWGNRAYLVQFLKIDLSLGEMLYVMHDCTYVGRTRKERILLL